MSTSNKPVKFIAIFTMIAGLLMIVAGGVTWGLVQSQLKDEHIVVAAVTPENPGRLAGKPVACPFTAYAQAAAIEYHALNGADGKTYAQLGADLTALKDKLTAAGASKEEVADDADVKALTLTRTSTMNGSFLRASLFTSVVSFGLSALVMGLGLLFILLGFALAKLSNTMVTVPASVPA
ncbi:MAG: hypothetical protein IMZ75_13605, partial [Actinobacteria bacterium]|nr:hypothetical protein [Actinomycetota bacterium]